MSRLADLDKGRLYTAIGAPRCPVCHGPMAPDLAIDVHPTCGRDFLQLVRREARR